MVNVYVFYIASICIHGEELLSNFTFHPELCTKLMVRRFTKLQLVREVQELLSRLSVTPEKITGRIMFMSMFNDM